MDSKERVKAIFEAFGRGDVPAIVEMAAADVDWGIDGEFSEALAWLRPGRGRDKVLAYFGGVGATMEVHTIVPKHIAGDGDHGLALIEIEFTVKQTGKRLRVEEAMHFTFNAAGQIVRYRGFCDTAGRNRAYARDQ